MKRTDPIFRASILSAVEQVPPGGTVQFAPGTYVAGRFIEVAVPRITLVGAERTLEVLPPPMTLIPLPTSPRGCAIR